jgi:hypothetical protein
MANSRVPAEGSGLPQGDDPQFWTFDMVEARLAEAVRCWWRMPGGGQWPFASDGPWHLIRKQWEDWDARDPKPIGRLPLRRAEVAAMEEATEWLTYVVADGTRRLMIAGLIERAKGRKQTGWAALREQLQDPGTSAYMSMQYSRGIGFIANVLNAMSGVPYAPKGVRMRYPKAVLDAVERLRSAEICGGRLSSPGMIEQ